MKHKLILWAGILSILFLNAPQASAAGRLVSVDALGVRIAPGFRVSIFADAAQANDVQAMTVDSYGHVIVSGPGYLRTLIDANFDGRADTTREFAPTSTGAQGLCSDGTLLYATSDGALCRFRDADGDGIADGPPERILPLEFAEHGAHGVRTGPDGAIYILGGNDVRFTDQHLNSREAPIRSVEGGGVLRLLPDSLYAHALAQGFRNAWDFDFNFVGDCFTADSEAEGDMYLPWYNAARLFHIESGGHHGWRLPGAKRSWSRPDFYIDTTEVMARIGPALPRGVTCYRHLQFPAYYRNGLFVSDWASGRIYFVPLRIAGASYQTAPEVFLEPIGLNGFAPSALTVAPDGTLLIATGGRKARGGVYRITSMGGGLAPIAASNWWVNAVSELDAVLTAPQPLEGWSRAAWAPIATRLGPIPFAEAAGDPALLPILRMRAIEILTEFHGGLAPALAEAVSRANSPLVRARVAWSLGRVPADNFAPILLALSRDPDPVVRRFALEAMVERFPRLDVPILQQAIGSNLAHPEKRIRQCAARLASLLPDPAWQALWDQLQQGLPQPRLTGILALLWRTSPNATVNTPAVEACLVILAQNKIPEIRLQALRLLTLALGDYRLQNPSLELYTGYEPAFTISSADPLARRICAVLRAGFPSGLPLADQETARMLAMLEDNDPALPNRLLAFISESSSPSSDFHYLTVLTKLTGPVPTNVQAVAHALVGMDAKLGGRGQHPKLNWSVRLLELTRNLLRRDSRLADALLLESGFPSSAHLDLVALLEGDKYTTAAHLFQAAVEKAPNVDLTPPLIDLLAVLPEEKVNPLFRMRWTNSTARDHLTLKLAAKPEPIDRDKFNASLLSDNPAVVRASLAALLKLPKDGRPGVLSTGLRALKNLCQEPKEDALRSELLAWFNRETGQSINVQEAGGDPAAIRRAYQPLFAWFAVKYPLVAKTMESTESDPASGWEATLRQVPWDRGNPQRGGAIFQNRCYSCHGPSRLGPDLAEACNRLARNDLFQAMVSPEHEIASGYRPMTFHTRSRQAYTGFVIYESSEVVLLQTGGAATVRLFDSDIVARREARVSFMPKGVLNGLKALELADLYSYLKVLAPVPKP